MDHMKYHNSSLQEIIQDGHFEKSYSTALVPMRYCKSALWLIHELSYSQGFTHLCVYSRQMKDNIDQPRLTVHEIMEFNLGNK